MKYKFGNSKQISDRRKHVLGELPSDIFVTPMTIGGHDGSYHSRDLTALTKMGHVKRKRFYFGVSSGHWRYKRAIREGA